MARKKTKTKATKKVARKKVARKRVAKSAKAGTGKGAKKARTPRATMSAPKAAPLASVDSVRAMDLLRAWSPSRY